MQLDFWSDLFASAHWCFLTRVAKLLNLLALCLAINSKSCVARLLHIIGLEYGLGLFKCLIS